MKLELEKLNLEEMLWKHVHVDPNFLKNAKKDFKPPKDVQEDSIDVQEDVWEKHAELVQELLVQHPNLLINCALENTQEDVEDFTTEEKENVKELLLLL